MFSSLVGGYGNRPAHTTQQEWDAISYRRRRKIKLLVSVSKRNDTAKTKMTNQIYLYTTTAGVFWDPPEVRTPVLST